MDKYNGMIRHCMTMHSNSPSFLSKFSNQLNPYFHEGLIKESKKEEIVKEPMSSSPRSTAQFLSSQVSSPFMNLPSVLCPTAQLHSPMFLEDHVEEQYPTTGKYSWVHSMNTDLESLLEISIKGNGHFEGNSIPGSCFHEDANHRAYAGNAKELPTDEKKSDSVSNNEQSLSLNDRTDNERELRGEFSSESPHDPIEDGYNWQKYGQKQVKGGECPQSYYRSTQQNCQVKKEVERFHNHPKNSGTKPRIQSSLPFNDFMVGALEHGDRRNDSLEATSSASLHNSFYHPYTTVCSRDCVSSGNKKDDLKEVFGLLPCHETDREENGSKRRKSEASANDISSAARTACEARVVVQTVSEVDILDDGYRWRKYGQKVVKGNPNPRSYYKCTSPGCNVRKHIERASDDLKFVLTTYEGKHNHDVPIARSLKEAASIVSSLLSSDHFHEIADQLHLMKDRFLISEGNLLEPNTSFRFWNGKEGHVNLSSVSTRTDLPTKPVKMQFIKPAPLSLIHFHDSGTGFTLNGGSA